MSGKTAKLETLKMYAWYIAWTVAGGCGLKNILAAPSEDAKASSAFTLMYRFLGLRHSRLSE